MSARHRHPAEHSSVLNGAGGVNGKLVKPQPDDDGSSTMDGDPQLPLDFGGINETAAADPVSVVDDPTEDEPATPWSRRRLSAGPLPRAAWSVAALGLVMLILGVIGGPFEGKLTGVQKNDNASYLPKSAESTRAGDEIAKFSPVQTVPGFVVYQRHGGLQAQDKDVITADVATFKGLAGVAADQVSDPSYASDQATATVAVPLIAKSGSVNVQGSDLVLAQKRVVTAARAGAPTGLAVYGSGPAGLLSALIDAFSGIDGTLLVAALAVVILILLVVYRSPILWIFPLISALLALCAAALIIYALADSGRLTLTGQSQGILSVLILGAGTDYALLLISRYREELSGETYRVDAMIRAWRGAAPPIAASAATVILGLLCLTFGELNSDRSLGPVCAIGIACTVGVMLTFLPAFLVLFDRWIFWPRIPSAERQIEAVSHPLWDRVAAAVGRRDRVGWIASTAFLLICILGLLTLKTDGLSSTTAFTNRPDAVVGQKIFDQHFDAGAGAPAQIVVDAAMATDLADVVARIPGVATAPGSVCVLTDYAKAAAAAVQAASAAKAARAAQAAGAKIGLAKTASAGATPQSRPGPRPLTTEFSAAQPVAETADGPVAIGQPAVSPVAPVPTANPPAVTPGAIEGTSPPSTGAPSTVAPGHEPVAHPAPPTPAPSVNQAAGCPPAAVRVSPIDGRLVVNATLADRYDTPQAYQTVQRIRSVVVGLYGSSTLVGGSSAINYDTQQASAHDRDLIIPIVLLVIMIVLALLLRSLLAPVLLILTVVLSFGAALGVSAVMFNHVFHFANADPAFPLFAFVFLVALGIDYNIFLMTRVREEAEAHGTREGVLRGLAVTGGVITSAGVVLAATFAVLGVLPIVFLGEVGFTVAFGVLLDTILVRSILVPALAHDLGRQIWWPSRLARRAH